MVTVGTILRDQITVRLVVIPSGTGIEAGREAGSGTAVSAQVSHPTRRSGWLDETTLLGSAGRSPGRGQKKSQGLGLCLLTPHDAGNLSHSQA